MHVLITGGAGYIGSMLCGRLLYEGHQVTVLDKLIFGGDSILAYMAHPAFHFHHVDITETRIRPYLTGVDAVVHLAAIVGFPACQAVGHNVAWRYNVEATKEVYEDALAAGVKRFVFASTYSNYGLGPEGQMVTEESPLNPQSLYAETKIACEEFLLQQKEQPCVPVLFRFATLFGISPRTRFDLIVNQFVLDAMMQRKLIIYQRGYARSFIHIRDVVRAIILGLTSDEKIVGGQIFNVGSEKGNYSKDEIVALVQKHVKNVEIQYKDLSFGGDMRDIRVSFEKIRRVLGFELSISVEDGVIEVRDAIESGLVANPLAEKHRNAQ
ncbi:MAG TPA: NAD(P)-dependent oxidoreductase, partial [Aggregatilineaceae bacterium]|nr:NAD(P)-dependent oxidoreductase [Aggregatilineaceae bacterium]